MASASGSRAHSPISSSAAAGSAATRSGPQPRGPARGVPRPPVSTSRRGSGAVGGDQAGELAAAGDQDHGGGGAPAAAAGPGPGRARCPARSASAGRPGRLRYSAWRPSSVAGRRAAGTPSASRNARSASAGGSGSAGPEPAQVHIQLPVGEIGRRALRPVHRQRGLADPRGPADRRDQHRRHPAAEVRQQRRQPRQLPRPPGEPGNRRPGSILGLRGTVGRARGALRRRRACPLRSRRSSSSVRSDRRIRWFSSRSPGPGSIPICSTKCRRTCRYASSADACCPDRYNASISNSPAAPATAPPPPAPAPPPPPHDDGPNANPPQPAPPAPPAASPSAAAPHPPPKPPTAHPPAAAPATTPKPQKASPTPHPKPPRAPRAAAACSSVNRVTSSSPGMTSIR